MNYTKNKSINWSEISADPNSSEVLDFRAINLAIARSRQLIPDRIAYLCNLASEKNVLDIGIVEHFSASSDRKSWLHGELCKYASTCLGVDILEKEIQALCDKGYKAIVWDATKFPLSQKFDLIVIGDVIEHVGNPSALFANVSEMLNPGGRIVVTTPNPWYANAIFKNIFEGRPFTDSVDHVAWFDPGTLYEISARNGLILDKYSGVMTKKSLSTKSRFFFSIAPFLLKIGIRQEFFAKTMLYEFVLPAHRQ